MSFEPTLARLESIAELLQAVADEEIMPRFRHLEATDIRSKISRIDVVTEADEAAERAISKALQLQFPDARIIGEEAVYLQPALLDALHGQQLTILVDPVDGTRNFAAGLGLFGVMVAFVLRGRVLASVICDPLLRDFAFAARGQGAWLRDSSGNVRRLRVATARPAFELEGCGSWLNLSEPERSRTARNLSRFAAHAAYRCAAHEYRLIASGQYDFALYHKLAPWDHAPGVILHEEAGGYCAHLDGAPYDPTRTTGGLLCATDAASWHEVRDILCASDGWAPNSANAHHETAA
ncbi:MAG: inositol monophosphatase family protein [Casimicrobium sp.]|jgi:fructose-1,6-bisphosphatase/inositol monophosphatase family enzyme